MQIGNQSQEPPIISCALNIRKLGYRHVLPLSELCWPFSALCLCLTAYNWQYTRYVWAGLLGQLMAIC